MEVSAEPFTGSRSGEQAIQAQAFWTESLRGLTAPTPLLSEPTGRQSLRQAGFQQYSVPLPDAVVSATEWLQVQGLDCETLLLGAWSLLLHCYSGDNDIVFGVHTVFDRRSSLPAANSPLPLRATVLPDAQLLPWLKQLQHHWTTLQSYKDVSLPQVQAWSEIPAGLPLFESLILFRDRAIVPAAIPTDCSSTDRDNHPTHSLGGDYPLTLIVTARDLQVRYDRARWEDATMTRLLGHLQTLLEAMVTHGNGRLAEISPLTAAERHQLLVEWAHNPVEYPRQHCIHHLFEAQVSKTPDAIAVVLPGVEQDRQLTYRELNDRATALSVQLQQLGVQRETFVAISMERTIELIVAILGILKAGGVYVPLDPTYPVDRVAWMLQDSQAPVILTQSHLVDHLPPHSAKIVCLDAEWGCNAPSNSAQSCPVAATDLAYVNYTSGSTGRPKGVAVPHRGVVRLVFGTCFTPLDGSQTILQLAPIPFDAATFEIWGALLHGGCCVLYPPSGIPDPKELQGIIRRYRITTLFLTTALFNTLIAEVPEALAGVKDVLTGGEAISIPHIRRALESLPHTRLIHVYGPTESTTFACSYPIPRQIDAHLTTLPIGKPIANTEFYVLNSVLQPVPIGVIGELYIGGDGLAREYLNRPDLTQEKFIPHPFQPSESARLYKTGDQVRYRPDGTVEFVGRQDNQVKIRGFRIELGEIEAVLRQHDAVADAIVVMREDLPGEKRLVAYVTANDQQPLSLISLRCYLSDRLAAYMLPAALMVLEKFPLSPTGKIDRRALPVPARGGASQTFVAPTTEVEQALAEIWCGVLGLEQVGIEENFFDLGGTSLLGLQMIARVQKQFGSDLRAVKLYEHPTIRALAQALSQGAEPVTAHSSIQARAQRQRSAHQRRKA